MQPNDGQLLVRFLQNRDEHAFDELVKRHAGMVMAVCRRIIGDARDAEEAFQNTFLVLIRKAGLHLQAESIGGWLYNVAARTALDMRGKRLTQASRFVEQEKIEMIPQTEESISTAWEAMKGLLDEELIQLADKYRQPLVLCYLEGKNTEQAAQDLGLSYSALKVRLMRGRELLRKRLVRRGTTVSAGMLAAVLLEQSAKAAEVVSEVLIQSTVKAATALISTAAGVTAITAVSKLIILKGILMNIIYSKTALVIGGLTLISVPFLVWGNFNKNKSIQPSANIIHSVKDGGVSNQAMAAIKESVSTSRPETVESVPDKNVAASSSTNLLPVSSARDFLLCFKLASELPDSKERWQILRKLGINISDEDFDNAWNTFLKEHTRVSVNKNHYNFGLQMAVFNEWLKKDPASAVNLIYRLSKLPEQDATTALAILNDGSLYNVALNSESFPFFIISDDMTIVKDGEYKYQIQGGGTAVGMPDAKPFLSVLLERWAVQDYQAAWAWAKDLPDDKERQSMLKVVELGKTIRTALSNYNPKEGLETLFSIEKEFQENVANHRFSLNPETGAIGAKWAERDLNAALDWANSQTGRTAAVLSAQSKIYMTWTKNDFPAVLAMVTQSTKYYLAMDLARRNIAETWVETDQQSALDWMEQVLSNQETYNKSRKDLARIILDFWSKGDPEGAAAWWTQKYQGVNSKDDIESLDKLISNWKNVDPESANQWVQASLSAEMRDSLEQQHQRDRKKWIIASDETARDKYVNFVNDKKNVDKVKDEAFMDKFTDDLFKEIRERSGKSAGE